MFKKKFLVFLIPLILLIVIMSVLFIPRIIYKLNIPQYDTELLTYDEYIAEGYMDGNVTTTLRDTDSQKIDVLSNIDEVKYTEDFQLVFTVDEEVIAIQVLNAGNYGYWYAPEGSLQLGAYREYGPMVFSVGYNPDETGMFQSFYTLFNDGTCLYPEQGGEHIEDEELCQSTLDDVLNELGYDSVEELIIDSAPYIKSEE